MTNPSDEAVEIYDHEFKDIGTMDCDECGEHISKHHDKMDVLARKTMETIIEHGHQVRFIFPTEESAATGQDYPFWYSVGRTVQDKPEFLVTGPLPYQMGCYIINEAARKFDEEPFAPGDEVVGILDAFPIKVIAADPVAADMYGVTQNFGDDVMPALQLLWPDTAGKFPGDANYDERFKQPQFSPK